MVLTLFTVLQIHNPAAYSAATVGLNVEWQAVMMESVKKAGAGVE
jgi:hypothetical protein